MKDSHQSPRLSLRTVSPINIVLATHNMFSSPHSAANEGGGAGHTVVEQEPEDHEQQTMMTMRTTTPSPPAQRARVVSDFDMSRMPVIIKRTLHPWSVHRSLTTSKFIATIVRPAATGSSTAGSTKVKHLQCPFPTEREARKFCKAYSPPKFLTAASDHCMLCAVSLISGTSHRPRGHCRNCGVVICERCTCRWGLRMVPKTYVPQAASTVRVCKSCDWLSNAFCMALLQGRYQDALRLYETVSSYTRWWVLCIGYMKHFVQHAVWSILTVVSL